MFKYSIKRFVPLTSGAPRKRLSKPVLLIFGIALVFAIIGFIDLKVNAAEPLHFNYIKLGIDRGGSGSNYVMINKEFSYTKPVYFYYWYTDPTARNMEIQFYMLSEEPINNIDTSTINYNGKNYYCYSLYTSSYGTATSSILLESNGTTTTYIRKLNSKIIGSEQEFIAMHLNDTLDYERPPIDYDSLEVDDSMPIPENFVLNKLYDDKQVFDYIEWTNTSDLSIQVQVCPISVVYENKNLGFSYGNWIDSFDGDYFHEEHLWPLSYNYTFEVFNPKKYYTGMEYAYPEALEHFEKIDAEQDNGTFGSVNLYHTFGYRFRYYDLDSMKAGPWIHVWPDRIIGKYVSYIVYSDDSFSNDVNASGVEQEFTGSTLEEAIGKVKDELTFKDKYDIVDGDADVTEVTGWLKSVVGFIKSTPSVIGSVLGFLPQPILYGMYVVLFLGVIAAGYAIIRALI